MYLWEGIIFEIVHVVTKFWRLYDKNRVLSDEIDSCFNMSDSVSGKKQTISSEATRHTKGKGSSELSVYKSSAEVTVRKTSSKESSVNKSSDEYFEYCCDPCSTEGEHVEAHGFCTECNEYLCGTCYKSHSRSKLSRHHTLLDKDNMPRKAFKTCGPCKSATEEVEAAGYCTNCNEYLCDDCFKSHARSKLSKHHVLLDKANIPIEPESSLSSSIAGMNICDRSAGNKEYKHIRDVNVAAVGDKSSCYIIDMTLVSDTKLVLSDCNNKCLKLIDVGKSTLLNRLDLHSDPFGITTVSRDQVAVALPNHYQIQLILVNGGLSVLRILKTCDMCMDVFCMKDELYVSYQNPVKFEILHLTGAVHKTIMPGPEVSKHCTNPRHIAVSQDESLIFVSAGKNNNFMCLNMDGNVVSIYPGQLDRPHGVTISPFGSVYLCNKRQHVVYNMPLDLSEATVVLGKGDGLEYPIAVCFNPGKQHLYVSSGSSKFRNFIKIFKWQ